MFSYFGGKIRLAPSYQPPKHAVIVEPFAGAAGYSMFWLNEIPHTSALLIEKDPQIVALWSRVLSMTPDEIMAIQTPVKGERTDDLLIALSANGATVSGTMANQGSVQVTDWMARDWASVRLRIATTRARISADRITVCLGSWDEIDAADVGEATWFIDPPYQHQGHRYHMGSDGIDYPALGAWCQQLPGQTIVAEAEPADWLPFEIHTAARDIKSGQKIELVWCSDPEPTLWDF